MLTNKILLFVAKFAQRNRVNCKRSVIFVAEYNQALNIKIINKSNHRKLSESSMLAQNTLGKFSRLKLKCSVSTYLNKC